MLDDWRKAKVTPIFKEDVGNLGLVSLTSVPEKVTEQILLEAISKHMKGKIMIGSNRH